MEGCVSGEEVKLWGCSTVVLFISGRSLAVDLGWAALRRAEFSLVVCSAGVARSAFLLLVLLDFWRLGGCEEAIEDGIKMAGVGAGKTLAVGQRDAGGAGSVTQFTRLSKGQVTIIIVIS